MAGLAETRDVGSWLPLAANVRRICCIGDSMTYGYGVTPRQTLATHIARFANMAYPDQIIWVDNCGRSSGNIWDSWVPLARLAERTRFDAVVFSLCENDAEILSSNTVKYHHTDMDGNIETWITDGRLNSILCRTLAELARVARMHEFCLIPHFYTSYPPSRPVADAVAAECAAVGLPFVNLLRFFSDEYGPSILQMVASPFDDHPSDGGHRVAARRIVQELWKYWTPPPCEEGAVADRLLEVCTHAVDNGWSPDDVYGWALQTLDAKAVIARRQRSENTAFLGDLGNARVIIEDRYRRWYAQCASAAKTHLLHERRDGPWADLEQAYHSIGRLNEMGFIVDHFGDSATAAELWGLLDRAGYYNENNRLKALPVDLKARFLSMAESTLSEGTRQSPPLLQEFARLRADLGRNLQRLATLLPDEFVGESLDPSLLRLWQVTYYQVEIAGAYLQQVQRAVNETDAATPGQPVFLTTINVRVERDSRRTKRDALFAMTVEVDYIEPKRARRRQHLWAGDGEDAYVYSFAMPLLLLGDVGIGVSIRDPLHKLFLDGELSLTRVEISNFPATTLQPRPRFVWEPVNTSDRVHWLKLERILVPA